jgi:hypothetical protein
MTIDEVGEDEAHDVDEHPQHPRSYLRKRHWECMTQRSTEQFVKRRGVWKTMNWRRSMMISWEMEEAKAIMMLPVTAQTGKMCTKIAMCLERRHRLPPTDGFPRGDGFVQDKGGGTGHGVDRGARDKGGAVRRAGEMI